MKTLFIFDSSKSIGKGHESRCMNIASDLNSLGADNYLATSKKSTISTSNLKAFKSVFFFNDKEALFKHLMESTIEYTSIVVDNYDISSNELIDASRIYSVYKFDLIPDLKERRIKFISFNPDLNAKSDFHCLGPQYFPFKKEFLEAKKRSNCQNKSLFVFFGGGDNTTLIKRYSNYFEFVHKKGFEINIVVTKLYSGINKVSQSMQFVDFIEEPADIAAIISQSSFCFISGGTIIYECIFLGKFPQVISTASNQISQSYAYHNRGMANYVGCSTETSAQELVDDFKRNFSRYVNTIEKHPPDEFSMNNKLLANEIYNGFK